LKIGSAFKLNPTFFLFWFVSVIFFHLCLDSILQMWTGGNDRADEERNLHFISVHFLIIANLFIVKKKPSKT